MRIPRRVASEKPTSRYVHYQINEPLFNEKCIMAFITVTVCEFLSTRDCYYVDCVEYLATGLCQWLLPRSQPASANNH